MNYQEAEQLSKEKALQIAKGLGGDWCRKVCTSGWVEVLHSGTWGFRVAAEGVSSKPRLELFGVRPQSENFTEYKAVWSSVSTYGLDMPSITVAADRPIETICKEIRRRLLPGIQEYHATFLERAKALSLLHDSQGEVAEKLADALDGYKTGGKDGVQFHVSRDAKLIGMEYSTRVLFKVGHSGDDASLDVDNLPVEMAKALAGFIASWMDRAESESSNG